MLTTPNGSDTRNSAKSGLTPLLKLFKLDLALGKQRSESGGEQILVLLLANALLGTNVAELLLIYLAVFIHATANSVAYFIQVFFCRFVNDRLSASMYFFVKFQRLSCFYCSVPFSGIVDYRCTILFNLNNTMYNRRR